MSISSIIALNSAIKQMQENDNNAANLDAKKTQTAQAQQELELNKKLQDSKVKIQNNEGLISDWRTKQLLDNNNDKYKPISDAFDAASQLQDLTDHKLQNQQEQLKGQVQQHLQDPDVQNFMANMMGKSSTAQPPMSMQTPSGTEDVQGEQARVAPSIMPDMQSGATPGVATPQGSVSPENVNTQVQAPVGTTDNSAPAIPEPKANVSMPQPQQEPEPQTPEGLTPIKNLLGRMDNVPYGDPRAQIRDTQVPNPNYRMQLAMGDKNARPYSPVSADVIDRTNPLRLSPAQNKMREHIPDLLAKGYTRDEILHNLPSDLSSIVKSIGEYKQPESELMNRATPAFRTAMGGMIQQLYPNYSANDYAAKASYMKGLTNTTPASVGGQVLSTNAMAAHLGELYQRAQSMQNSNVPVGNMITNFVKQNLGHPEVNDFNAAKEIFSNELQRLLSGKASTQGGVKETASTLNANSSPAQLMTVLKTYANAAVEKINPLRQQYENTLGEQENGKILYPQTRNILNGIIGRDRFKEFDNGGGETSGSEQGQTSNGKDYSHLWK